jgi:hypothetical protein
MPAIWGIPAGRKKMHPIDNRALVPISSVSNPG